MGRHVYRQRDGRFAIWSTVVDAFIVTDATPEEAAAVLAEPAVVAAHEEVAEAGPIPDDVWVEWTQTAPGDGT